MQLCSLRPLFSGENIDVQLLDYVRSIVIFVVKLLEADVLLSMRVLKTCCLQR